MCCDFGVLISDYGYQHSGGLAGDCVRDESITIPDSCSHGQVAAMVSQGYRKAAGDVCSGGSEEQYSPVQVACNAGKKGSMLQHQSFLILWWLIESLSCCF